MAKAPSDIRSLARSHTDAALRTLAGIMRQPDAPAAARVAACQVLLDRGWGKAVQPIEAKVQQIMAESLSDNDLADIAAGRSEGASEAPLDPSQLN